MNRKIIAKNYGILMYPMKITTLLGNELVIIKKFTFSQLFNTKVGICKQIKIQCPNSNIFTSGRKKNMRNVKKTCINKLNNLWNFIPLYKIKRRVY